MISVKGIACLLVVVLSLAATSCPATAFTDEDKKKDYFQRPGVKVSEIVEARGYLAEEHSLITQEGYVLGMTRALNPLIGRKRRRMLNKQPLLFIHGTLVDGNSFVMNSFDIEAPKDFSSVNVDLMDEKRLIELFADEPSAKSLAFFALNFGHEVWFMHRRGAPLSQRRIERRFKNAIMPTVMDKYLGAVELAKRGFRGKRRNFKSEHLRPARSFDFSEQKTDSDSFQTDNGDPDVQRAGVSSSARSFQEFNKEKKANKKREKSHSKVVEAVEAAPAALLDYGNLGMDIKVTLDKRLWNHSFDEQAAFDIPETVDFVLEQTGHQRLVLVGDSSGGGLILMTLVLNPTLGDKLSKAIAWVPSFNIGHGKHSDTYKALLPLFDYIGPFPFTFISNPFQALMEVACSLEILQITLCTLTLDSSWGDSAGMAPVRPEYQSAYLTPVAAHEYQHLIQMITKKQTRMYDFRNTTKNQLVYGRDEPPYYNTSLINFDYLSIYVGTSDTLVTIEDIDTVRKELKVPRRIRVLDQPGVNHGGALFHNKVAQIVIIPTYKDIISHGYKDWPAMRDADWG